jgi:hypothetical protein
MVTGGKPVFILFAIDPNRFAVQLSVVLELIYQFRLIPPPASYFLTGQKVSKKALREFKLVRLLPDSNMNSRTSKYDNYMINFIIKSQI